MRVVVEMRYSILFVLALILISGFIAYFGDILGRRLGKKRLTLFNLRPRYTAIVVTTITGMLISGLAVLALISVNSQFRRVLTEGERIFSNNKRLLTQNLSLSRSNRSLSQRRSELLKLVDQRQKELDAARKQVEQARMARDAAARVAERLKSDIADRKKDVELLRGRKLTLESELETRTEELASVQAGLAEAQEDLKKRQGELLVVGQRLTVTAANLDKAQASLSEAQTKLSKTQSQLTDVQIQLAAKTRELEAKEKELFAEKGQRIRFERQTDELRSGNLILRQGDEIARGVISFDQTQFGIRADLISLLEKASEIAERRSARVGENGRAVNVIFRLPNGSVSNLPESVCLDYARDAIARSRTDALVQVVCAANTVAGEQAPVEFLLYTNKLVFAEGDFIAETRMDGRSSEGRVLLAIISFLQGAVAEAALQKGIVPVANYDPRQTIASNPQRQLESLLQVVDEIRAGRSKADLRVYASTDISAAGPLNMDNMRFSVTKVE